MVATSRSRGKTLNRGLCFMEDFLQCAMIGAEFFNHGVEALAVVVVDGVRKFVDDQVVDDG